MRIDLRSDTVTRPTTGMLETMLNAKVGDDVFNEDPTVIALEEKAAKLFGKQAGLFCPSGTMTNQIAVKVHTNPANEIICSRLAHVYNYEGGGMAFNSGVSIRMIEGNRGRFTAKDVLENINPTDDVHFPLTKLVTIENTCNKGGGCYWDIKDIKDIKEACDKYGLRLHLDGARLFNALEETGETPEEYGQLFDSVSICLSKGLGAPVGSLLLGTKDFIWEARRTRKLLGGAMRQAGYLAAAGIYAMDNHIERLKEDHQRAQQIGEMVEVLPYVEELLPIETNIVIFRLNDSISSADYLKALEEKGIIAVQMAPQLIRFVTHLDFTDEMLEKLPEILKNAI
ncbi:MAG: threonine aldolase [Flavobacteriales bacterium]|nr:MAG: threonine aldolase [Flavobacteriales bacterium]